MDNTKHNQPGAAQESDDLIAELARLVAQDARDNSAQSDAYKRQEPRFAPEPEPVEPVQNDFYEAEASFGEPGEREPEIEPEAPSEPVVDEGDLLPGFDAGSGDELSSADPIAELIADAEVEAYDRDFAQETDWTDESGEGAQPSDFDAFAPEQTYERTEDFAVSAHEQPMPPPSRDERDPLSEIEALIGEAARVDVGTDGGLSGRRVRSSYLEGTETDAAVDAAESAILAAAAATGASVRRTEPADPENWLEPQEPQRSEPEELIEEPDAVPASDYHPDPLFAPVAADTAPRAAEEAPVFEDEDGEFIAERPRRRLNGFVLPVAAGVAIVALIGGVYFTFFSGPPEPGEAPVLTADAQPLKEEAAPTNTETAASDSVVFNEIEGNTGSPEDEALVSRDQTDGASGAQVAEVLAPEEGEMELVNRPVRTVTVRPDGTIVQAEDSVAGSNVLPVDRPDVPAVPNSTLTSDPIGEAIAQAMAGEAAATAGNGAEQVASLDAATAAPAAEDAGVEAPAAEDPNAPIPIPRPAGLTASGGATTTTAVTPTLETPVAAPTPSAAETALAVPSPTPTQTETQATAPAAATSTPGAWVQLASQRSEDVAQAGVAELQTRYGSLFGGAELEVSRVDLGERGIYYRVRLPQPSLADANNVCSSIQAQGGDCFVMDN